MGYCNYSNGITTTGIFYIPVDSDLNADDVVIRTYTNIIYKNKVIIVDDIFWVFKKTASGDSKVSNDEIWRNKELHKLYNLLDKLNEHQINLMYEYYDDNVFQDFKIINYLESIIKNE